MMKGEAVKLEKEGEDAIERSDRGTASTKGIKSRPVKMLEAKVERRTGSEAIGTRSGKNKKGTPRKWRPLSLRGKLNNYY